MQTYQARTYSPWEEAVEDLCEEVPGCIYLSLSDYARFRKREDDPTRSCASLTQDARPPLRVACVCAVPDDECRAVNQRTGRDPEFGARL